MKTSRRISLTLAILAAILLPAPTAALADTTPSGQQFGQHVRTCAQTMGFTSSHNPGIHYGYAGWDGMSCDS